jgi:hypothetical protein
VNGSISVTDNSHYSYTIAFDVKVDAAAVVTENTVNAKPGEATMIWAPTITGPTTIANTTAGHTLPVEQWVTCGHSATGCLALYGFWPGDSPVCTTKIAGRMRVDEVVPFGQRHSRRVHPAGDGEFCELQVGWTVVIATRDPIPVGGIKSYPWIIEEQHVTLKDETQYQPLVESLRAGPAVWVAIMADTDGSMTDFVYNVDSCMASPPHSIWSSGPLDCSD